MSFFVDLLQYQNVAVAAATVLAAAAGSSRLIRDISTRGADKADRSAREAEQAAESTLGTEKAAETTLDDASAEQAAAGFEAGLQRTAGEGRHVAQPPLKLTRGELEKATIMKAHGKELDAEAMRIAKRYGSREPSDKHMRMAAERIGVLRDRAGVTSDIALGIGSLLIGAAASYLVTIGTGGEESGQMNLAATLALCVGVGMFVAAAVVKWRRS